MSVCLGALETASALHSVFQRVNTCIFPRDPKRPTPAPRSPRPRTGGRVLQELFDLCRGKLRSGHGEADPQLLQGRFDVGLFKVGIEGRRGNSPRSAVG